MPDTFWEATTGGIHYSAGNVGIGTDTPTASLTVVGSEDEGGSSLGPELITNGTFTGNADGWYLHDDANGSASYNDNNVTVSYTGVEDYTDISTTTDFTIESGKTYELSFDISNATDDVVFYFNNTTDADCPDHCVPIYSSDYIDGHYGNGHHTFTFTSSYDGTDVLSFASYNWNTDTGWTIDNVSVREEVSVSSPPILSVGRSSLPPFFSVTGREVFVGATSSNSIWNEVGRARINIFAGGMATGGSGDSTAYQLADGVSVSFDESTGHSDEIWAYVCPGGCVAVSDSDNVLDDATFSGPFTGDASSYDAGIVFVVSISDVGDPDSFSWEERGLGSCSGRQGSIGIGGDVELEGDIGDGCAVNDLLAEGGPTSLDEVGGSLVNTARTLAVVDSNAADLFVVANNGSFTLGNITVDHHGILKSTPIISYDGEGSANIVLGAPLSPEHGIVDTQLSVGEGGQILSTDGAGGLVWINNDTAAIKYLYNSGAGSGSYIGISSGVDGNGNIDNYVSTIAIGDQAGLGAIGLSDSIFIGRTSGASTFGVTHSQFIGALAGAGATNASYSNFLGLNAGREAPNAAWSNFFGYWAGYGAENAQNSIFIGINAGVNDTVDNTESNTDDDCIGDFPQLPNCYSILIGPYTSTGGFSNSIAIGAHAMNTSSNQLMIGSATGDPLFSQPINTTIWKGASSTECTLTTGTGLACTSDENLKTNIQDLPTDTLDKLLNLKTVTYHWKANPDGNQMIGFLAQDIEQYFPELVETNTEGKKSVYYAQITPVIVEAIREMNLNVIGIGDLARENTWRDALIEWFASATNGINNFFSHRVTTDELCVRDDEGQTCLTRSQIEQILGSGVTDEEADNEEGEEPADETETETPEEEPEPPAEPTTPQAPEENSSAPEEVPDAPADTPAAL